MIAFAVFSIAVVVYRLIRGLFTRQEGVVLGIFVLAILVITAQSCLEYGQLRFDLPERRYVIQLTVLLYGWGVWGVLHLPLRAARRFVLPVVLMGLVAYHGIMLVKSHLPFGRRAAFVAASNWAVERIRADYHGPTADATNVFSLAEYHRPNRPVVHGHNPRIGYLLGGRDESLSIFGAADQPDYWVTGHLDDEFDREAYEFVDAYVFGKRRFELYRRR